MTGALPLVVNEPQAYQRSHETVCKTVLSWRLGPPNTYSFFEHDSFRFSRSMIYSPSFRIWPIIFNVFYPCEITGSSVSPCTTEVATGEKRPHLCCKLAWSAWYNRVFQLCTEELRPLESDVCCRVGEEEQKVGVHIKQAKGLGSLGAGVEHV